MKTTLLIILISLLFNNSYSQDYEDLFYDKQLQIEYKDTLQNIGKRLTGEWLYLGNRNRIKNGVLTDSISITYTTDGIETLLIVENGVYFEIEERERKKADYFYKTTFDFNSEFPSYSNDMIYFDEDITVITSCQPIPELIYYKNDFGILYNGMAAYSLEIISELNDKRLIFKNGEEYLRIK